jgi:hypothetical protein
VGIQVHLRVEHTVDFFFPGGVAAHKSLEGCGLIRRPVEKGVFLNLDPFRGFVVGAPSVIAILFDVTRLALKGELVGQSAGLSNLFLQLLELFVEVLEIEFQPRTPVLCPMIKFLHLLIEPHGLSGGQPE